MFELLQYFAGLTFFFIFYSRSGSIHYQPN